MPKSKKSLGTYQPGNSNISQEINEIIVLGEFDQNANLIAFIGPGGKRFFAGTSGVNQLTAGQGIALNPPTGLGTVQVINTAMGTVSSVGLQMPTPFVVTDSPVTQSGNLIVEWGVGQVPPQNLTSGPYRSDYFINALGQSQEVVATSIPYLTFVGSATGGFNQTFTSDTLLAYNGDETRLTVSLNGVILSPVTSYTLAGNTLTVLDYLLPNAEIEVLSKAITAGGGTTLGSVTNVSVSAALANAFRVLTPSTTPVIDLATTITNPTSSYLQGSGMFSQDPQILGRSLDIESSGQYTATLSTATVTALSATTLTLSSIGTLAVGSFISATPALFTAQPIFAVTGNVITITNTTPWGVPPNPTTTTLYVWTVPAHYSLLTYNRATQQYRSAGYLNLFNTQNNILMGFTDAYYPAIVAGTTNNLVISNTGLTTLSGASNVVLGNGAGAALDASSRNVAIGFNGGVGLMNTSNDNIAIGTNTFANGAAFTHTDNVGIGSNAMSCVLGLPAGTAARNVAIGSRAMAQHGAVSNNVAIGFFALNAPGTAQNNIAIGSFAGVGVASGGNNIIMGFQAGLALGVGNNNIYIGNESGSECQITSGNTIIGAFNGNQTSAPARPTDLDLRTINSNYFVISDNRTTPNILAVCDNNQNWGFGNSTPLGKVHIEGALRVQQAWEKAVIDPLTVLTGTIAIPVGRAGEFLFTANATANFVFNFNGNNPDAEPPTTATLDSILPVGHSVTVSIVTTQGATAFFCNQIQIDGTVVAAANINWQGPTAPAFGNANSRDVYTFVIFKSAAATFSVLASRNQYGG